LAFIFILIALILVGSYLSRDIMQIIYQSQGPMASKYFIKTKKKL